jgi:hypothetical protein
MQKKTPLDCLIRQVGSRHAPHKAPDEIIVPILINPDRAFWEWKKEVFFLVSKYRGNQCGGKINVAIDEFARSWRLNLAIEYHVQASDTPFETTAKKIAEELYDPEGPERKLESIIKDWVNHYVKQVGGPYEFMTGYFAHHAGLIDSLQRWARDQLFLELNLWIKIQTETPVNETEELPAFTTKVVFNDYDRAVDLKVEMLSLDLDNDPKRKILAYIRSGELNKLREVLERKLREIIREDYRLRDFRGSTAPSSVKQRLKDRLNKTAGDFGRCIRVLDLRCDTPWFATHDVYQSDKFDFKVNVPEYPKVVTVTADMQMELQNLGLYASAGIPKVEDWVRETLESAIVLRLTRHTYVQLIQVWEEEKRQIEEDLTKRAASIGYQWIHSNITTDLPFDRVRRRFEIQLDEVITTSNSESKVTLHVNAWVKIDDVSVLAAKFPTEIDIDARVKEALALVLQRIGKEHSPKDWHLNFDAHSNPNKKPVKLLVQEALEEQLVSSFGGKLVSITITRDGGLVEKLTELREQTPCFKIHVTRAKFETEFAYRVVDVMEELWHRFEATKPSIEQLNERIRLHIQQDFADEDPTIFRRRTNREIIKALNEGRAHDGVPYMIGAQYGLSIYIDHWIRTTTDIEAQEDQVRHDAERVVLTEEQILLRAHGEETYRDLDLKQKLKNDLRERIQKLNPLEDAEDIARLERRLSELDKEIQKQSSEALRLILTRKAADSERQLARSLGQDPKALPEARQPERDSPEGAHPPA